jgi:hypothetical protein
MTSYNDRFDLEQQIMACWNITDELDMVLKSYDDLTEDQLLNVLLGLKELYSIKFTRCFETFEKCVGNRSI